MLRPLRLASGFALALALAAPAFAQAGSATCVSGAATLNGVTYACNRVDLAARRALSTFTAGTSPAPNGANEVWGWTDPVTGKEIALVGLSNGLGFVDVTAPAAPVYLGKLPSATTGNNLWRTFRVYQNVVYVGSEASGHGIQFFDLTRLRGVTTPQAFTANGRYTGVSNTHTLVINEQTGYLYAVGTNQCGGGPHMVDIRTPLTPTFAGCISTDGYTHEAQALVYDGPDAQYVGREILVMYQGQGSAQTGGQVSFFDVTNKAAPVRISTVAYPNAGYSHQGWFTPDRRHILVNDEFDQSAPGSRTIVLNVADLNNPGFAFNYNSAKRTYAHNLYVVGRYAYMSNYTSGLRIVDVQNMTAGGFAEVASFDTYQQNDGYSYNGQWMNYPFFASGTIVATDIQNGLFVLRPTGLVVDAADGPADTATGYALSDPVPNPASDGARLTLSVDAVQAVTAEVFSVTGRRVATAFSGSVAPGAAVEIGVDGASLPAGVYVVRVTGERFVAARRLVLTR